MAAKKKSPKDRLIGGRYRTERELGRGAGGVVYLARDEHLRGKRLAVKVLEVQKSHFALLAGSLKNEFSTLSLLRHKNLAQVYDFGADPKEIYFSSEWVDGQDILKATHRTDLNTVFQLVVQVLRAVDFLHRRGVLHLDLKPANLLVTDPDRTGELTAKLIDFGIAQWKRKGKLGPGEFSGTPPYSAPEIMMEKPATTASDIYSLGILFHQIFAGRLPFRSAETFEMMQEQIYQDPLRLEEINPALPEDFPELLRKMVSRDPAQRFQSSREVLEAINRSLGENFTLRSPTAPIRILEESDYSFREDLIETLATAFKRGDPEPFLLAGPAGIGKSHLMRRLKERLQLEGVTPLWIEDWKTFEDSIHAGIFSPQSPLFIDLGAEDDIVPWVSALQEKKCPSLLSVHLPSQASPRTLELEPLSRDSVLRFLQNEVADFPGSSNEGGVLADLSGGLPSRLEEILQALREEGTLQWTDRGWQWRSELESDLFHLLERQQIRWKERLGRVLEVLKFSQIGLDAKILEGIVGLEAGALEEKLSEWTKAGHLVQQSKEGSLLYFSNRPTGLEGIVDFPTDWTWVKRELERLYEKDEYDKGVEWARLIESKEMKLGEVPPEVRVLCARHLAASGDVSKALQTLPPEPPPEAEVAGLFHEVRGRCYFALGKLEECGEEIKKGERCYESRNDRIGLAALANQKGLLLTELNQFDSAESAFARAIELAEEAKDPFLTAISEGNLGTFYYNRGLLERARSAYNKALLLSESFAHPLASCMIRQRLINLLYYLGRAQDAERDCYDLLKRSIQFRYPHQQAVALNYLALLAGQKDHREQQLRRLDQAIGLLNPDKPTPLLAQLFINRSYVNLDLKKFVPAQLDGEAALNLAQKRSNQALASLARLILGKIFRDRTKPDFTAASQFLEKAEEGITETRNIQLLWEVSYERGLLAKKQKQMRDALAHFLSAQDHLKSVLKEIPEEHRESYLRDRKLEKIASELEQLRSSPSEEEQLS